MHSLKSSKWLQPKQEGQQQQHQPGPSSSLGVETAGQEKQAQAQRPALMSLRDLASRIGLVPRELNNNNNSNSQPEGRSVASPACAPSPLPPADYPTPQSPPSRKLHPRPKPAEVFRSYANQTGEEGPGRSSLGVKRQRSYHSDHQRSSKEVRNIFFQWSSQGEIDHLDRRQSWVTRATPLIHQRLPRTNQSLIQTLHRPTLPQIC